jgi:hypothetical protein
MSSSIPSGLCQCGCGQQTTLATYSRPSKGIVKGQPHRYVHSHAHRKPLLMQTCALCGTVIARRQQQSYCSHRCEGLARRRPPDECFWAKVVKTATCWRWTGATNDHGYGRLTVTENGRKKSVYAHRFSWELHRGPLPPGLDVCHDCDVTCCVRPDHLFLGTTTDNMQDASRKGRVRRGPDWQAFCRTIAARGEHHGSQTHPERWSRGEHRPHAKLTATEVRLIRTMNGRFPRAEVAAFFDIHPGTVWKIWLGKTWTHVP